MEEEEEEEEVEEEEERELRTHFIISRRKRAQFGKGNETNWN